MKYKIRFEQTVEGTETCECVVEADDKDLAFKKFQDKEYLSYLVVKRDVTMTPMDEFVYDFYGIE